VTLQYDDHKDDPANQVADQQHDRLLDEVDQADNAKQLDHYRKRP
jgi:hypothetical protein